ncbi:MAG: ABC transporter substrate-binding protein [Bacteroidetes bacterium]|nr:ABC transporter substrate-binding protein [Bacteroidota bacterium]
MNKIFLFIIAVILVISCNNYPNTNKDVIENGIRIVSLAPSITKELESFNMTENIVGATSYCDISKKNKELIVGTATEVNIEKILLLNPDIVIASGLTKQTTINTLKNNGIAVHFIKKMQSFDDICNQAIELGTLVGKADLALSIVKRSRQRVDSMQSLIPSRHNKLKVFFQIGAKPIFTVIPNTFMNDYIIFSGCENLAADMDRGTITRESVLRRNPDVIFIVTMGIVGNEEKKKWESYAELNAVKSKKIFIIDSNIACTPTVLSFTETLEQVIKKIY